MKIVHAIALAAAVVSTSAVAAGDPAIGKQKGMHCVACHGSETFPGIFPLVQLAGRDADKLTIKTNKYRTGKLFSPLMSLAVVGLTDKDVDDISAYYNAMGKPYLQMPGIRGDEDIAETAAK
ncbi:MAG: Cytochrome c4 [Proteobacteria bacterium]|jgi:cytochrome c553|nr:Cytochrome c4 [Pseudomonadota bacterium]